MRFDLVARKVAPTPLRFPGKLLADEAGNRLFISDSNHNRIVITDARRKVTGYRRQRCHRSRGRRLANATFDHPQGMALVGTTLYVADTENHLIRKVDLQTEDAC